MFVRVAADSLVLFLRVLGLLLFFEFFLKKKGGGDWAYLVSRSFDP